MKIPLSYILRNLWTRRLTTALTAGGLALVVFVFATVLMLDEGLRTTLVATGEQDNVVVIRRSAETEVQSGVERRQASIIATHPAIAMGSDGAPLVSKETVVLISLHKRGSDKPSNVVIRGIAPTAQEKDTNLNRRLEQICTQSAETLRKQLAKVKLSELASKE